VSLAGSTGSIGTQAASVVRDNPERFRIVAIGARSSVDTLVEQAKEFSPEIVAIAESGREAELIERCPRGTEIRSGTEALASLGEAADVVVNAVVGFAGLPVTLSALGSGHRLALANKESLIAAGPLVRSAKETPGAELVPVDSEHGALHQCLRSETQGVGSGRTVKKLVLTASGGPFRGRKADALKSVTVDEALNHPTWKMGPKITIDSSTLFNKGLEVIEAHELFDFDFDDIEVVVHPQSILHSAVEFTDGSTVAQMSHPDMRLPLGYAMGHPDRLATPYGVIDWATIGPLTFEPPDRIAFPCLDLAYQAGRVGGTAPAWLNAANEVAVDAFLAKRVTWDRISSIIEETLMNHDAMVPDSVEIVVEADAAARRFAKSALEKQAQA